MDRFMVRVERSRKTSFWAGRNGGDGRGGIPLQRHGRDVLIIDRTELLEKKNLESDFLG